MRNLPTAIQFSAEGRKILLFHATPRKNNLYWFEDRPEKFFLEMASKTDADVLIYGHTHKPYKKELKGKVFINAGSVGKPKDGDPRACLTLMEITQARRLIRCHDVRCRAAITGSGLPAYFAEKLKQGK
jgi:putative phosphoesterase